MSIEIKISIISVIIALISAFFANKSNRIAKKALLLSEKQYMDSQPDFNLYYNEGLRFIVDQNSTLKRLLLFHITIRNKSSHRNTLKADLEMEYLRKDDTFAKVLVEHNPNLKDLLKNRNLPVFPIDIELEAKSTATKWMIFEQPDLIDKNYRIEKYEIRTTDLYDNKSIIEAVLIKNVN